MRVMRKTSVTAVDSHQHSNRDGVLSLANNALTTWDIVPVTLWKRQGEIQKNVNAVRASLGQEPLTVQDHQQSQSSEMVCSDKPWLTIGKAYRDSYRPVSNREFLGMLSKALEGTRHELTSIGTCGRRARRFAAFKIVGLDDYTAGGRQFGQYLTAVDFLDQQGTLAWGFNQFCFTCANQFNRIYSQCNNRAKHTSGIMIRVAQFSDMIEQAIGVAAEFRMAFESLSQQSITREDARASFAGFVANGADELATRSLNVVDELENLFARGRGNRGQTKADAFSAITDYYTHANVRGNAAEREFNQFSSSMFGPGAAKKEEFWSMVNDPNSLAQTIEHGREVLRASE